MYAMGRFNRIFSAQAGTIGEIGGTTMRKTNPMNLAYDLFMATGNPAYYLLYAGIRDADERR